MSIHQVTEPDFRVVIHGGSGLDRQWHFIPVHYMRGMFKDKNGKLIELYEDIDFSLEDLNQVVVDSYRDENGEIGDEFIPEEEFLEAHFQYLQKAILFQAVSCGLTEEQIDFSGVKHNF